MEAQTQSKWEGKVSAALPIPAAQEVWSFLEDFCNLHKWLPSIDTCYHVEGIPGQPGLIRYCAATPTSSSGGHDETVYWAKEKLLTIDPTKRCLSYEVAENNMGLNSYLATMIVSPADDDGKRGCKIEWAFVCDPIEGWKLENWVSYLESSIQSMAKKMEEALLSTR